MKLGWIVVMVMISMSSGCASIVSGVNQPISVETRLNGEPLAGAACRLSSNKGTWFVTTPGSLTVHRGFQDLTVECAKVGLASSVDMVPSHVKAMAFGNILFGGVIGVAVDSGDGAAFDYPDLISIDMGRRDGSRPATNIDASESVSKASASLSAPAGTLDSSPRAPTLAPVAAPSIEEKRSGTVVPAGRSELHYLVAAEAMARAQSCNARPVATFVASGPGYETYSVPCTSGETVLMRCEFGNCRALR